MSIIWTVGSLYFWINNELRAKDPRDILKAYPWITILVPCYNEALTIEITCKNLCSLDYPNYQVVFIDDCSHDDTANILRIYIDKYPYFHLISLEQNHGKAGALNIALGFINTPFVLILDADTLISGNALRYLVMAFIQRQGIGAVTANPIPHNRKGFLSKFQTAEFMSIIGLIKRCQGMFGHIFTVSGCATLYKTEILKKAGGFSTVTATEDIDATWRIQRQGYRIWFQPQALALIQVPERLKEYWVQRKRWATGGWHFLRCHKDIFLRWRYRHLWLLFIDFVLSYTWAFCFIIVTIAWIISFVIGTGIYTGPSSILHGSIISIICLIQMSFAIAINSSYEKDIKKCLFWVPWYPFLFFIVGALLVVWTAPKSLFGSLKDSGKWKSPTRL